METQQIEKRPLRLPPLPRPGKPLYERRRNRFQDTRSALIAAFDGAVNRGELDLVIIADESGFVVSQSTTDLDLTMLAAVAPLVGRGRARATVKRDGQERGLSVKTIEVLGETLYVACLGGKFGSRERELATSASAAKRILLS
ncbi:hypothetical protein OV203_14775 [Nannocystis sp. ILAH1]|uniref:hypothetical protein n=1 Tax=unclassified Nannocystis TaxID=2627009 RepID=UPI00227108C1|nr:MULTISPECIES: hypothetical protein [unclassified Nannocystis]MCY0988394.1 hypothetical protein [Nannocystis sp. ILAH1]MCY1067644.1 hypothetical protein [Nannocystis sp. RBIL2]